jgi:hypothetical protein
MLEDHHALEAAMTRVATVLDGLIDRRTAAIETRAAVVAFAGLLDDHLTREEDVAFGRIERFFTEHEWGAIEKQFAKGVSVRALVFTLPWVLDDADGFTTRSVLTTLPAHISVLNRLVFRRSYRHVVEPLLAAPKSSKRYIMSSSPSVRFPRL